jgi:acetyl esterase/lipase
LPSAPVGSLLAHRQVDRREVSVPARDGARIRLSVFSPAHPGRATAAPRVYWIHGGGMVMGDRFSQIDIPLEWLDEFGAIVISVGYRSHRKPPAPPSSTPSSTTVTKVAVRL